MTKLIRLDNGDWIDPAIIESIQYLPRQSCEFTGDVHKDRVVIWSKGGDSIPLYYDNEQEARAAQGTIGTQINVDRVDD